MFKQPKVVTLWLPLTLANTIHFQVLLPLLFVKWLIASSLFSLWLRREPKGKCLVKVVLANYSEQSQIKLDNGFQSWLYNGNQPEKIKKENRGPIPRDSETAESWWNFKSSSGHVNTAKPTVHCIRHWVITLCQSNHYLGVVCPQDCYVELWSNRDYI